MKKIKKKTWFIIGITGLVILLSILGAILLQKKKQEEKISGYTSLNQFESIQEIIEYMNNTYQTEKKSEKEGYDLDIYLEFRYPLDTSKDYVEVFFQKLINNVSYVARYQNLRLIDTKKDIIIEIVGDKNNNLVSQVKINGVEDYFRKKKQEEDFKNYEEQKITSFSIESSQLIECVQNNWVASKVNLGTKETTLDKYDIYFDEGLKVKTIQYRVSELIFTKQYTSSIVNGIKVGQSFEDIIKVLGAPTVGDEDSLMLGYYGENFIIFFTEEEIAVYRVDRSYKTENLEKLIEEYLQTDDEKRLMNQLTDLYNDYTSYQYDTNYFEIVYPARGFKVSYNKGEFNGVTFYLNYPGIVYDGKTVKELVSSNVELPKRIEIQVEKKNDIFYLQESSRLLMEDYYKHAMMEEEESETSNKSSKFIMVNTKESGTSNIKIISKDGKYPDNEFSDYTDINSWLWIDDAVAFYSIKNQGIYVYNAETKWYGKILEGTEEYDLKEYKDNVLTYDNDKKIKINY